MTDNTMTNSVNSVDWTDLLDPLYSAVGEPDLWNAVLDKLCEGLNAHSAFFFTPCPQMLDLPYHHSKRYRIETAQDYVQNFVHEDVYNMAALNRDLFKMGTIGTGEDLIPMHELKQTNFFNNFLVKHNQGHLLTSLPFSQANTYAIAPVVLSFFRPIDSDPFTQVEVDILSKLMPHIQRAWLLHDQAIRYKNLNNLLQSALNQLSHGTILLDSNNKMQFANTVAKRFLSDLYLYELKTLQVSTLSLPKSLIDVAKKVTGDKVVAKKITLEKNQQWYIVAAPLSKFPHLGAEASADATVIWLVKDQNNEKNNVWLLADLFRLTSAETRVLELLLSSYSPIEIADKLDIKITTIRTHIAALLAKTHSKRQQDLIHMAAAFDFFKVDA